MLHILSTTNPSIVNRDNTSVFSISQSQIPVSNCTTDPICHIICSSARQCQNMTINASLAQRLLLTCTADYACDQLSIIEGPISNATIACTSQYGCTSAQFNLDSVINTVNLICDDPTATGPTNNTACHGAKLYANNAAEINVECGPNSCKYMDFNISNAKTANFLIKHDGAIGANIYGNNIKNELNIKCDKKYGCKGTNIYATNASELILACRGELACHGTQIYCPWNDQNCTIKCNGTSHCSSMDIYLENNQQYLDLICRTNQYACKNISFGCQDDGSSTQLQYSPEPLIGLICADDKCCPPPYDTLCQSNQPCHV